MAEITRLPQGRSIQVSMNTGTVGMPRTTPNDFGAQNWQNWQRLGQEVIQADVSYMTHFIQEDHQRQEDEAKEDLLTYDTVQQQRLDNLLMTQGANALNAPEQYLEGREDPGYVLPERRGGELYERNMSLGKLRIDNQNVQTLGKHVLRQRETLRIQSAEATSARALQKIERQPGLLDEELSNTILPNVRIQLDTQGITDPDLRKFYEDQARIGAVKTALISMAAEHGAEEALKMFSDPQIQAYKELVGPVAWEKIFNVQNARLQAKKAQEENRALQVEAYQKISSLYEAGLDPITINNQMIAEYGPQLGVPAVAALANNVYSLPRKAQATQQSKLVNEYKQLAMSTNLGWTPDNLQWRAQMRGPDDVAALAQAQKEILAEAKEGDSYKVHYLTNNSESIIARQMRAGEYDEARRTLIKMSNELTASEYQQINKVINEHESVVVGTVVTPLERQLSLAKTYKDLRDAELEQSKVISLSRVLASEGAPELSEAYKSLSYEQKEYVDKQLQRIRYSQSGWVVDENIQAANFYKYDSMSNSDLNELFQTEVGTSTILRELGGPNTKFYQDIWKKSQNPDVKTQYATRAQIQAIQRAQAIAYRSGNSITPSELKELRPVISDAVTSGLTEYQLTHNLDNPNKIPPNIREAIIMNAVYDVTNERQGLKITGSGTTVELSQLQNVYPEIAERSIIVNMPTVSNDWESISANNSLGFRMIRKRNVKDQQVPPVWTYKKNPITNISEWVQENIPYSAGVSSPDPGINAALQRISVHAQQFDSTTRGRLCFYPSSNQFYLYGIAGNVLAKYSIDGATL